MEQRQLDELQAWFDAYVTGFYGDDDTINASVKYKQNHTQRVCREIRHIADKLNLPNPQKRIAQAVALFHDIGRFEQFVRFRTFNDAMSVRHPVLGAQILRQEGILEPLEESQREWILKAIEYHAEKQLPAELNGSCLLFAQLIRDADKLDIYHTVTRYYEQYKDNPQDSSLVLGLPDRPECSPQVVEKMLRRESIDYGELQTLNDLKLMQLEWVYDINFVVTLERIAEYRFLEKLTRFLPITAETKTITQRIYTYVDERLNRQRH